MGSHLSGQLLRTIREECKPPATSKPIVETYLEGSSTFQANGSTEVLEKEGRGCGKRAVSRSFVVTLHLLLPRPSFRPQGEISLLFPRPSPLPFFFNSLDMPIPTCHTVAHPANRPGPTQGRSWRRRLALYV